MTPPPSAPPRARIEQLTGLRFFAAVLVFAVHFRWDTSPEPLTAIAAEGYVGVTFFFILSGFVLTHSYAARVREGRISFRRYFLLRLARLTPLHYLSGIPFLYFSIMGMEAIYSEPFGILKTVLNLTYLQTWVPVSSIYFSLNAPSWSLSNEVFFYACFFWLVMLSPRRLFAATMGLAGIVLLAAILAWLFLGEARFFGAYPFAHWVFYIFPGFRILEFMVGMVLHRVWSAGHRLPAALTPLAYVLLLAAMWAAPGIPDPFRYSLFYLPFVMVFFFAHLTEATAFDRAYSSRLLVLLGNASFAFYLVHQPILHLMNIFLRPSIPGDAVFLPVSFLLTAAASVVVYKIYEMPAERFLKRWINGTGRQDAPHRAGPVRLDSDM